MNVIASFLFIMQSGGKNEHNSVSIERLIVMMMLVFIRLLYSLNIEEENQYKK